MNKQEAKLEAILFAYGEAIKIDRLSDFLKISKEELSDLVENLQKFYKSNKNGLQIVFKGNTIQLVSNPMFGKDIAEFLDKRINEPLTRAAMEVLSIIAYRGPMTRSQIEHIRGVNCSFMIRNLAIRGLIEKGDNPASPRSYLYSVTGDFIKSMGIERIEQLPDFELLSKTDIKQGVKDIDVSKESEEKV